MQSSHPWPGQPCSGKAGLPGVHQNIDGAVGAVVGIDRPAHFLATFDPEPDGRPADARLPLWSAGGAFCLAVTVPVVVLGIFWDRVFEWAKIAASTLL